MPGITEAHVKTAMKPLPAGKSAYDVNDGKTGLVLRVGRRGAKWAWRTEVHTKTFRLTLGVVSFLTLTQARALAGAATEQIRDRSGRVDDAWLQRELVARHLIEPPPPEPEPSRNIVAEIYARIEADARWTFAQARERYLAEVKRTKRPDTWNDYRVILHAPELARFEGTKVFTVSVETFAKAIAEVHATGKERRAEKMADTLRPMWTWLGSKAVTLDSGVKAGVMKELRAPERSRDEEGDDDEDEDGHGTYVPPVAELGRILAVCRAGVVNHVIAAALELQILTAQRRRTIVNARRRDFVIEGDVMVWKIPPAFRKTARKRGVKRSHDLPLKDAARAAVERMLQRNVQSPWLFAGLRPQKAGDDVTHINVSALNHNVRIMPGIIASPHDFRRGFATHAQELLGVEFLETKLILDHNEGIETDDVTESAYSRARRLGKKSAVMEPWADLIEAAAEAAAPLLPPRPLLHAAMTEARKPKTSKPKVADEAAQPPASLA